MQPSSPHLSRFRPFIYSFLILVTVVGIRFFLFLFLGAVDLSWFKALLSRISLAVGWRAFLLFIGCPGGLAVLLSFAWKAWMLPELVCCMDDSNHRGWTSLFDSSSGGNSIGSSEGSVNQPAPGSPEPVAPAAPPSPDAQGETPPLFQFVPLDDRAAVVSDLCSVISRNMSETNLQLPPGWASAEELAKHVWHVADQETPLGHIVYLQTELMRPDYRDGLIWREFVSEIELIRGAP